MNNKKIRLAETGLVVLLWIVLIAVPILFREDADKPVWRSLNSQLEILVPVFLVFLVNRVFLVPFLLLRKKLLPYFLSATGIILLCSLGSLYIDAKLNSPRAVLQPASQPPDNPPPPRQGEEQRPEPRQEPRPDQQPGDQPGEGNRQPRPVNPFANVIVLSVLVVGFDTGLRSGLRWIRAENEKVLIEREKVATQLVFLQNQVSPHFFMNTLNNIHSLVDKDSDQAKEAIIRLSKMMRYLLYETESDRTTLKKEFEFLESYINLMRLRFSRKVRIGLSLPDPVPEKEIPPFLFLSLIENAFKHGISYQGESFVDIDFTIGERRLMLIVRNSKTEQAASSGKPGIGISNTRKRLDLIFGSDYHLDIIDGKDTFTVNLSVPI